MDHLVRKLLAQKDGRPESARVGEIAASRYVSRDVFERERRMFARVPSPIALEADLVGAGACVPSEIAGVPIVIVRAEDGIRAFKNACRHRGTALVSEPCKKKAFVCPYHGWTYDLSGHRIHVPHEECFRESLSERTDLISVHVEARHGLIWGALEPFDLDCHLRPLADDLRALEGLSLHRRSVREVRGNWKLIIDAFLDGYHIRHLHKDTVYRFFMDARFEAEHASPHIRAVTARRALFERKDLPLRELVTPSTFVFPSTIVILHPDYASLLTMTPLAPDRTRFVHTMLVPGDVAERPKGAIRERTTERSEGDDVAERPKGAIRERTTERSEGDDVRDHWDKSFALIDEGVFAREDLAIVEAMQRGIESGANESLLFGELEYGSLWFHEALMAHDER